MEIETHFQLAGRYSPLSANALLLAMSRAGYSKTKARQAVLEALCAADGQATAAELLASGRQRHSRLGSVTVYRTLDLLLSLGLVRTLHTQDRGIAYALALHPHGHHVICVECHRAEEFAGCDISAVVSSAEAQTGFRVMSHRLEMLGLCSECQQATGSPLSFGVGRTDNSPAAPQGGISC